jgi:enolase
VLKAVENVNRVISKRLIGNDCTAQAEIDNLMLELDNTENKSKLGANAILSVSIAVCKAGALAKNLELYEYIGELIGNKKFTPPVPFMLIAEGGAHAGIENDIQEYMLAPLKFDTFKERLRAGVETYLTLKKMLKEKFGYISELVGYEGGLVPQIKDFEEKLEWIQRAIELAGYKNKVFIALDYNL